MNRRIKLIVLIASIVMILVLVVFVATQGNKEEAGQEALSPTQENKESDASIDYEDLDEANSTVKNESESEKDKEPFVESGAHLEYEDLDETDSTDKNEPEPEKDKDDSDDNNTQQGNTEQDDEAEDIFERIEDTSQGYGPIH